MEKKPDGKRLFVEDLARDAPESCRPCGVRARGADHHRSHDVEDGHFAVVTYGHRYFNERGELSYTRSSNGRSAMTEKPYILVVDDDGPILALMRNLLKEFGFQPLTADSGTNAIDAARQNRPSLVLLDKNMPGMTSDEVIRSLRSEPGCAGLPILILSGERLTRSDIAALGANDAVQKPFDVVQLIEQIRRYVDGNL